MQTIQQKQAAQGLNMRKSAGGQSDGSSWPRPTQPTIRYQCVARFHEQGRAAIEILERAFNK
jgi:hypothetical protein